MILQRFAERLYLMFGLLIVLFIVHPNAWAERIKVPVKVDQRALWINDEHRLGKFQRFFIKGVGYNPMPIGRHVSDWGYPRGDKRKIANIFDDPAILKRDFSLLKAAGFNTLRLWKANDTTSLDGRFPNKMTQRTLDLAWDYQLRIIPGFWVDDGDFTLPGFRLKQINAFRQFVKQFKSHPAILFWAIGNENNYRMKGDQKQLKAYYSLVNEMAKAAKFEEGFNEHPVAVVNGEIATVGLRSVGSDDASMSYVDIWGVNVYRGRSFGSLFRDFEAVSQKPIWISEFGIDAFKTSNVNNPDLGSEDTKVQAEWAGLLLDEIYKNAGIVIGSTYMEYSDEWWKPYEWLCQELYQKDCNGEHNHFGSVDNSSPDRFKNEEWFGLMAVQKSNIAAEADRMLPRPVYDVFKLRNARDLGDETAKIVIKTLIINPAKPKKNEKISLYIQVKNVSAIALKHPVMIKVEVFNKTYEITAPALKALESWTFQSQGIWSVVAPLAGQYRLSAYMSSEDSYTGHYDRYHAKELLFTVQ